MSRLAAWPALVMTAGLGTRLAPLSLVRAKAALPVAGEILIERILRRLRNAGVERVVLNLHHLPETITRVVGDGSQLGLRVRYSWEPTVLGSAGGPARALPLLEADRFLVINGDTMADVDLEALASAHVDTGATVTMAVVEGNPRYGGVVADPEGVVHGFVRPGASSPFNAFGVYHFVGAQAVNASAFAGVDPDRPFETVRELYPQLIARRPGSVRVSCTDAEFLDIGTPDGYLHMASHLAAREGRPLDRGERSRIAADAHVERSILWDDVTVETGASLVECIVADGVTVPAGANYRRSSLVKLNGKMIVEPF